MPRADRLHLGEPRGLDDGGHALLRLRDHDLERLHPLLAERHRLELDLEADPAARGHLGERGRKARGAQVLQRDDERAAGELERALEQLLAGEGIADLHRGTLLGALLVEVLRREDAGPADAVAPGERAVEDDLVADAGSGGPHELIGLEHPQRHRVDERVVTVGGVEDGLAADVRDADAVAVAADAAHDAVEEPAGPILVERAEPQRVEDRDRTGAHREDVAQDPADARGGTLVGLDGGGVVVALDLEGEREPVADVDHTRVLARALQHARAGGGQPPQLGTGVLVAAVLGPEQREDGELEVVRIAPHHLDDPLQLAVRQAERAVDRRFGGGRHPGHPSYRRGLPQPRRRRAVGTRSSPNFRKTSRAPALSLRPDATSDEEQRDEHHRAEREAARRAAAVGPRPGDRRGQLRERGGRRTAGLGRRRAPARARRIRARALLLPIERPRGAGAPDAARPPIGRASGLPSPGTPRLRKLVRELVA